MEWCMSDHASLDDPAGALVPTGEPPATADRRWGTADRLRAFVLTAIFLLLTGSILVDHSDPIFGVAVATAWTALFAIVWELAARALARVRG
jgi:hypothetical protein